MAVVRNRYLLRYTIVVVVVWAIIIVVRLPVGTIVRRPAAAVIPHPTTASLAPVVVEPTADVEIDEPPMVLHGRGTRRPAAEDKKVPPKYEAQDEHELPTEESIADGGDANPNNKGHSTANAGVTKGHLKRDKWTNSGPKRTHADDTRRDVVVKALRDSWEGYKKYAWGFDEFAPISRRTSNWGGGRGVGCTIVDALDTLLIAGLDHEADEAIEWVEGVLSFDQPIKLSVFETTIRILGGLLSTFEITQRPKVLEQALALGGKLARAFETQSGIPDNYVNIQNGHHEGAAWNGGAAILSELGSLQMEYFTLSKLAQQDRAREYWTKARAAIEKVEPQCTGGYCPRMFSGGFGNGAHAGLGSFGDSFYEYLLKQWILSGKTDELFHRMWLKAAEHTIRTSSTIGAHLIPNGQETGNTMEHLACFSGGLFALSYMHTGDQTHLDFAKKIAETCHAMYQTTTGLAPDVAVAQGNGQFSSSDSKFILRPETVETYFYLWRATHDPKYRDWGFEVMKAMDKHLKIEGAGYAGTINVHAIPARHNDNMETFWFAETLKYLYLLFSEDEKIDLHKWVFNTEAHPMRIVGAAGGKSSVKKEGGAAAASSAAGGSESSSASAGSDKAAVA